MKTTTEYPDVDIEIQGSNKQAGRKRQQTKRRVMAAYEKYEQTGNIGGLLIEVQKFAEGKLVWLEMKDAGFAGVPTPKTYEDWAQDVVIAVWEGLSKGSFRGDSADEFYAWVHRITWTTRNDFLKELIEAKECRVPLQIQVEDDYGSREIDNPAIYPDDGGYGSSGIRLPKDLSIVDRDICYLLLSPVNNGNGGTRTRTYAEIGEVLGISEGAVKKRIQRMRDKLQKPNREGSS